MAGSHTIGLSSEPRQVRKEATVLGDLCDMGCLATHFFEGNSF